MSGVTEWREVQNRAAETSAAAAAWRSIVAADFDDT